MVTANGTRVTVHEAMHRLHRASATGVGRARAAAHQSTAAQSLADPAVLHYDFALLQDIVLLLGASAVGGVGAALTHMPPVVGYLAVRARRRSLGVAGVVCEPVRRSLRLAHASRHRRVQTCARSSRLV